MFKINEAIEKEQARAKERGQMFFASTLAARIWPDASKASQRMNISKLCNGVSKRITPDMVQVICDTCHVTPNFLFGYDKNNKRNSQ